MKLSKATIAILKNFATINGGIQFVEGNEIRVGAIDRSVMGIAKVEETFPVDFALYDLNQFLSVLSMFNEPELEFKEDYMIIKQGRNRVKYFYTDSDNIVAAPYELELEPGEETMFISADQLDSLTKASAVMKLDDFAIVKEGDSIQLIVEDGEQDSNNEFTIDVEFEVDMDDFELQLKMKTLNFVKLDYEISFVDNNQFLIFSNEDNQLTYYVAVQ